jgi:site-specific DNA recombinase
MNMKKVAAYCRVSTNRQEKEENIEVQEGLVKEWATKNNAVIVEWYKDDGWSGELLARPDLDRLRDDVNKRIWDAVVFVDRDRLARKLSFQELVIDELNEKNLELIFLNEPLADNPEGRIMQQIKGVFAEYERAKIAERMRRGKIHKAKSGKLVGHNAPYGYRYHPKLGEKNGYYEIYEPEAEVVRMIFKWAAEDGYSLRRIVKELFKRNILPAKKIRDCWTKSSVDRVLNRTDYYGDSYYNETVAVVPKNPQTKDGYKKIKKSSRRIKPKDEWIKIAVPKIIDKDLFDKAHIRLKENIITNPRNKIYPYKLTGKVYCQCGAKRVGDGVNGHHYYRCAQRIYKYPLPNKCTYEGVNAEILDQMVMNNMINILTNPSLIKGQVEKWYNRQSKVTDTSQSELQRLKSALKKLKDEEQKVLRAYKADLLDFEGFKQEMKDIKGKRELLEIQANEVNQTSLNDDVSLESINDLCIAVLQSVKYDTATDRQELIRKLVQSIYVGERSSAEVNGRIPLVTQAQNIHYEPISRNRWASECR